MKFASIKSIKIAAGISIGAAAVALAVLLSGQNVRASTPGPLALTQPACACAATSISNGRSLHNCQCGVLQCVVTTGDANAAAPVALVCTR